MVAASPQVERVRKLMSLARSSNPHEAARAAERARDLMAKYRLSEDDVSEEVVVVIDDRRDPQREDLARVVGVAYRCIAAASRRGALAFRGTKRGAERARDVYHSLADLAESRAASGSPDPSAREAWRVCFWAGFVDAVVGRFLDRLFPGRSKTDSKDKPVPPAALVMVTALEKYALSSASDDPRSDAEVLMRSAYERGRSVGECANIPDESRASVFLGGAR